MEFKGSNGSVWLEGDHIRIQHRGFANLLTAGAHGEKAIPLANVTAVQFKAAGWTAGYIQFSLRGGIDRPGGVMEATKDENAVLFAKEHQASFERLRAEVEECINRPAARAETSPPSSVATELERLANLLERGYLTRHEFEAQKAQLLS